MIKIFIFFFILNQIKHYFIEVRVSQSLVCSVVFCRSLFVLFLLIISLSVPLQFTVSDYPFIWYLQTFLVVLRFTISDYLYV